MKICYLADAQNVSTEKWVNYFARRGHDCHVISRRSHLDWYGEGYTHGVQVHWLTAVIPQHWPKSGYTNTLFEFILVRRLIKRIKPDIVHAHGAVRDAYLAVASGFHPIVVSAWGSDVLIDAKRSPLIKFCTRCALKRANLVTCDCVYLMEGTIKLGAEPDKTKLIYHGVDTRKFSPERGKGIRENLGLPGVPVVISTRKLRPIYNVEMLIRAIPLVLEHMPQVEFIIAGEGEQRKYLESLAASLGVSGSVIFTGWVPPDRLPDYLVSASVYVSTSLSDSTSISLQEAMSCELAPIVTDLPANKEWIEDGENGFLVPVDDIQKIASRIVELISNRETREKFGKKSRMIIADRAELEQEMNKMEKLYQELLT